MRRFRYSILRHKYVELLCIKSEALGAVGVPAGQTLGPVAAASVDSAVEDVVKVLNELERVAPCKDDYSNLCLLLTLPRLSDHMHYKVIIFNLFILINGIIYLFILIGYIFNFLNLCLPRIGTQVMLEFNVFVKFIHW